MPAIGEVRFQTPTGLSSTYRAGATKVYWDGLNWSTNPNNTPQWGTGTGSMASNTPTPPPQTGPTPYETFVSQNAPKTDANAASLATNLMGRYQGLPDSTLSQLGQATTKLSNYTPEKINVGQVQTMPVEYYQKQIEDLSAPLASQYDRARSLMRGDQAARGTIYDSEGSSQIINDLDKPYLEQLGNITRGVQLKRMEDERANQQDYFTRLLDEAKDRRSIGLDATKSGADLISRTVLQKMGIDANTINSLLGYSADRYGTEANLFGNIYGSDTDYNKALLEQNAKSNDDLLRMLEMSGYTDQPQAQAFRALLDQELEKIGFQLQDLVPEGSEEQARAEPNSVPNIGTYAYGQDGQLYRATQSGWERA